MLELIFVVILYYDHIITFDAEIRTIWNRPLSIVSALFVVNRYSAAVGYIFILFFDAQPQYGLSVSLLMLWIFDQQTKVNILRNDSCKLSYRCHYTCHLLRVCSNSCVAGSLLPGILNSLNQIITSGSVFQ